MAHEQVVEHLRQAQQATEQALSHLAEAMKAAESYGKEYDSKNPDDSGPVCPPTSLMGRVK